MVASLLPTLVASAFVLLTVAGAFTLVRFEERRGRRVARDRTRAFARKLEAFFRGALDPRELRRAVRDADTAEFWSVLETPALETDRRRRRALGAALAGNPHTRRERRALGDDSPWRRELAARRLALIEEPGSRRALRAALGRGPAVVTLAAAVALGRYRDAWALRWLIAHPDSLARRDLRARVAVLRGFGRGALPVLAQALEGGIGDPGLERAVMDTLAVGGHAAAVPAIERRLASPEVELRAGAARALGRLRAAQCAPSLIAALEDREWAVRAVAAWALGRSRAGTAVEPLVARLTDRAWWVRRHAAYALWELGADGRAALRRVVEGSPDPYARDIARESLGSGESLDAA